MPSSLLNKTMCGGVWKCVLHTHSDCLCLCLFQHVDTWSFNVFALNEASGDHSLKFVFYELLTRYDLINRFKVFVCLSVSPSIIH